MAPDLFDELNPGTMERSLDRHLNGDWGSVSPEVAQENELALIKGGVIRSCYSFAGDKFVYITTDADRRTTRISLTVDS